METLKFLLQAKKADLETPEEVVREAVQWMHIQLNNAEIPHHYSDGGSGLGAYGDFQVNSLSKVTAVALSVRIAEINGIPYAFSEVRVSGQQEKILFPFFGEIGTPDGKLKILHYVADFILS
jgi:hypothetical protein